MVEVGKAYRSSLDGLIRWCISRSYRGYYHFRWLDKEGVWYAGGNYKDIPAHLVAEEVPAPQPGDTIRTATASGYVMEITL